MTPPPGLVEGATRTRRHYTAGFVATPWGAMEGETLCSLPDSWPVHVHTDETRQRWAEQWGSKFTPAADLPLCRKCERKAGQR